MRTAKCLSVGLVGILIGAGAIREALPQAGQRAENPQKQLAKAKLLETTGRDFARAAQIYNQVAQASPASSELQATAFYRLALCMQAMKKEAAATAALRRAAAGRGPDAASAKKLLQGQGPEDEARLEASVQRAVAALLREEKTGYSDVKWLGEVAVPEIVRAIRAHRYERDKVRRLTIQLCIIGGAEARRFFQDVQKSDDTLLRRAVASGVRESDKDAMNEVLRGFTNDPDSEVRADVLGSLDGVISRKEYIDRIRGAEDWDVAQACLFALSRRWQAKEHTQEERRKHYDAIAEWALAKWPQANAGQRQVLESVVSRVFAEDTFDSPIGRRLMLELIVASDHKRGGTHRPRHKPDNPRPGIEPATFAPAVAKIEKLKEEVLELALLERGHWGAAGMSLLLEMMKRGYDRENSWRQSGQLSDWILEVARPEDLPRIVEVVPYFVDPRAALQWIEKQPGFDGCVPALIALAKELPELSKGARNARRGLGLLRQQLPRTLLATRRPEVLGILLEMIGNETVAATQALYDLFEWKDPSALGAIEQVLDLPKIRDSERALALRHLLLQAPKRFAGLVPKSYERGLDTLSGGNDKKRQRANMYGSGLCYLWQPDSPNSDRWIPQIEESELARIFEQSLQGRGVESALHDCVTLLQDHGPSSRVIPDAVGAVILRSIPDLPMASSNGHLGQVIRNMALVRFPHLRQPILEMSRRMLESPNNNDRASTMGPLSLMPREFSVLADLLPSLRENLNHSSYQVWGAAMRAIAASNTDTAFELLVAQLTNEDAGRRWLAISELASHFPGRAEPHVIRMLSDSAAKVRRSAATAAGTLFSKKAVPALLRLMRDENAGVRKEAKENLDKIRYYHEQIAHWQKWLESSGLDAKSPAEALVEQARKGKTKAVRLAAIRSLGTLGEATTLPFLISLMEHEDVEIAKAATAAIQKINAK